MLSLQVSDKVGHRPSRLGYRHAAKFRFAFALLFQQTTHKFFVVGETKFNYSEIRGHFAI